MTTAMLDHLRQQQLAFQASVLGHPHSGLLRPSPGGSAAAVQIYQQAHGLRLAGALHDNFEMLAQALGDAAFATLAAAYTAAQPPHQPSIRWFGDQLASFMDQCVAADNGLVPHPALADLARMDWALRGAFDAADAQPLDRDALAGLAAEAWPALHLQLHPSAQTVPLQWAVEPAWQLLRAASAGSEPDLPAPRHSPHTLLVWRQGLETRWRSLPTAEATLLQAVAAGQPFEAWCARAATLVSSAEAAVPLVVGLLQQWLADGVLCGVAAAAGAHTPTDKPAEQPR